MGIFAKLAQFLGVRKKEASVVVVGLDNSGKSTILNWMKPEEVKSQEVVPTVGFNLEKFKYRQLNFTAFDMSGQGRYRNLWEHYYNDCNGVIFVIDSSDKLRMAVVKEELRVMMEHSAVRDRRVPILFFANKCDVQDALSSVKCSVMLGLDALRENPWHICATNALIGDGVYEGLDWLSDQMVAQLSKK